MVKRVRAPAVIVAAALAGVAGCDLLIGLQHGLPEGAGGADGGTSTGTGGSGTTSPSSTSSTASSASSSSGSACTTDAGSPAFCDRSWAHWSSIHPSAFVDNGDGTVTDKTTLLLWQKDYTSAQSQQTAVDFCKALSLAGHCDWRLPTRIELGTLVDYTRATPPLIDTTVFKADANGFWTSSPTAGSAGVTGWSVNFQSGLVVADTGVMVPLDARCIR